MIKQNNMGKKSVIIWDDEMNYLYGNIPKDNIERKYYKTILLKYDNYRISYDDFYEIIQNIFKNDSSVVLSKNSLYIDIYWGDYTFSKPIFSLKKLIKSRSLEKMEKRNKEIENQKF